MVKGDTLKCSIYFGMFVIIVFLSFKVKLNSVDEREHQREMTRLRQALWEARRKVKHKTVVQYENKESNMLHLLGLTQQNVSQNLVTASIVLLDF